MPQPVEQTVGPDGDSHGPVHDEVITIPETSEQERGMEIMTLKSGQIVVRGVKSNGSAALAGVKPLMVITKINEVADPGTSAYRWKRILQQNKSVRLTFSGKAKLDLTGASASGAVTTTSVAAGRVAFEGTKTKDGAPDALKSPSPPTAPDHFSHAAAALAPLQPSSWSCGVGNSAATESLTAAATQDAVDEGGGRKKKPIAVKQVSRECGIFPPHCALQIQRLFSQVAPPLSTRGKKSH